MTHDVAAPRYRNRPLLAEEVIFGASRAMQEVRKKLERVANTNIPLLICGETGSGKETLARFVHSIYPGETAPFQRMIPWGCERWQERTSFVQPNEDASVPYLKAPPEKPTCVGTVFFHEVAELSAVLQRRLVQLLLEDQPFSLGEAEHSRGLFRVICTTKHDIEQEMRRGIFREDLFYSINVVSLNLPPLRERREDIPGMVRYFWQYYRYKHGLDNTEPSSRLVDVLKRYDWPGNIRELARTMKRYVLLGSEKMIVDELRARVCRPQGYERVCDTGISLKSLARQEVQDLERAIILRTLSATHWNRRLAAQALNISYRSLLYKIKEAGVPHKRIVGKRGKQC